MVSARDLWKDRGNREPCSSSCLSRIETVQTTTKLLWRRKLQIGHGYPDSTENGK